MIALICQIRHKGTVGDPDVILGADAAAVLGPEAPADHGPTTVAENFSGHAQDAQFALIDDVFPVRFGPSGPNPRGVRLLAERRGRRDD